MMCSSDNGTQARQADASGIGSARGPGCVACGLPLRGRPFEVTENMFGWGGRFRYVECGACGCLQLDPVPVDLQRYYPPDYYAMARQEARGLTLMLKRVRANFYLGARRSLLGRLLAALTGRPAYVDWLLQGGVGPGQSVLDVGCGTGGYLAALTQTGFSRLLGVDPNIPADVDYGAGVRVIKGGFESVGGSFALVMLHHSFEHMPEPAAVLRGLAARVAERGTLLIRMPVVNRAWREYGTHWAQLDAPRHLHLHTEHSMGLLADRTGWRIERIDYDSTAFQFWASEQYSRGVPLLAPGVRRALPRGFSRRQLRAYEQEARRRNAGGQGDQACFWLRHR